MLFLFILMEMTVAKNEGLFLKLVSPFSLFAKQLHENQKKKKNLNSFIMQAIACLFD